MTYASRIAAAYPPAAPISNEIVRVALDVGAHPFDLANLIRFESGGTFSPSVKNRWSGATGLIQFYPGLSLKTLGVSVTELAAMTAQQQMAYVKQYLDIMRRGKSLNTPQKLYMSVFYPAAMSWSSSKKFPSNVPKSNPGIFTPNDYTAFVNKFSKLPSSQDPRSRPSPAPAPVRVPPLPPQGPTSVISTWRMPWSSAALWTNDSDFLAYLIQGDTSFPAGTLEPGLYQIRVHTGGVWRMLEATVSAEPGGTYSLTNLHGRWQWNTIS